MHDRNALQLARSKDSEAKFKEDLERANLDLNMVRERLEKVQADLVKARSEKEKAASDAEKSNYELERVTIQVNY